MKNSMVVETKKLKKSRFGRGKWCKNCGKRSLMHPNLNKPLFPWKKVGGCAKFEPVSEEYEVYINE